MGKQRDTQKTAKGATPQAAGSRKKDNPVSSKMDQGRKDSMSPKGHGGTSGAAPQSGKRRSEGNQSGPAEAGKNKSTSKVILLPAVVDPPGGSESASQDKELSESKIDDLVRRVMRNHNKAESASLENGLLLLVECFGGKLDEAQSKNPKKKESFGKICKHREMKVGATTLSRWVQSAHLVKTFEAQGKVFRNLTCSHYIALLPLEKFDDRLRLAQEADEKKSSVRDLAKEVKKLIPPSPKSLLDSISAALGNPKELAKEEKSESLSDKAKWAGLTPEDRETLITRVSKAKVSAQTFVNSMARFHKLLKEIASEAKSNKK